MKTAIFLRVIGPRGNDIYENFKFTGETAEADKTDYVKIMAKFEKFRKPQGERFISRHRLLCMKQEGLPIEKFETKLRKQARLYALGDLTDDLSRISRRSR